MGISYYNEYIRKAYFGRGEDVDCREELIALRKSTGMNRKEFSMYFGIPYRTVQDWELGNRQMPQYLLRLMAYKVRIEQLTRDAKEKKGD